MIVDGQIHTWRGVDTDCIVPPHISGTFDEQRVLPLMDASGVDRAILVTPVWTDSGDEVQKDMAIRFPDRFAVMAYMPVNEPQGRPRLESLLSEPGMLGVRATFSRRRYAVWLTDGTADWFFRTAAASGVPIMAYAPLRVADLGAMAERFPDLRLVVDHMAVPLTVKGTDLAPYIDEVVQLARLPNVAVKVSSLPHYSAAPWPHADVFDHVRRVVTSFGPNRAFWGSDITWGAEGEDLARLYDEAVTMMGEALAPFGDDGAALVMGRGIVDWLGWPASS